MNTKNSKNAITLIDDTVVFDFKNHLPDINPDELRDSFGVKAYSDLNYYGKLTPLGKGGVGLVFQGRDHNLGRNVAIKILKPGKRGQIRNISENK